MPEAEWLDVAAAAERHRCSTKTIWRRIREGVLPVRTEKISGGDGRPVNKVLIRVSDLNDAFGWTTRKAHVQKIRESAKPLTTEQKAAIGKVFLDHLREANRGEGRSGLASPSANRIPIEFRLDCQ